MDADEIKALRKRLGLTQDLFAQRLGTTQPTIAKWETGVSKPVGVAVMAMRQLDNQPRSFGEDSPVYDAG